jgi:hypothetical protein
LSFRTSSIVTREPDCWRVLTSSASIRNVCPKAWGGVLMLLLLPVEPISGTGPVI